MCELEMRVSVYGWPPENAVAVPESSLISDLATVDLGEYGDLNLVGSDGIRVPSSKLMLACRSEQLKLMIDASKASPDGGKSAELILGEFDSITLQAFSRFLTSDRSQGWNPAQETGEIQLALNMLKMGNQFGVKSLSDTAKKALLASELTRETALEMLKLSCENSYQLLKTKAAAYLAETQTFEEIKEHLCDLPPETLLDIIKNMKEKEYGRK